ncbi:hypothetical protein NDU88_000249 [Pleurodeles waltl]|uniref:Uncharacterized protein n=1 Tax=Pleurodeles waltl TaxID=8319 RepID=A0AAV7UPF6_PLEWA|nr:hypothetical protein NDU88_000249 [Pleurodeles waltl]
MRLHALPRHFGAAKSGAPCCRKRPAVGSGRGRPETCGPIAPPPRGKRRQRGEDFSGLQPERGLNSGPRLPEPRIPGYK